MLIYKVLSVIKWFLNLNSHFSFTVTPIFDLQGKWSILRHFCRKNYKICNFQNISTLRPKSIYILVKKIAPDDFSIHLGHFWEETVKVTNLSYFSLFFKKTAEYTQIWCLETPEIGQIDSFSILLHHVTFATFWGKCPGDLINCSDNAS